MLAAEEEEEDNFTTMPNYRWENESTTDSAVSEQLIGDNYEVYNYNNETSGTQKFEKSRELNSRDFYFESRFALDIGGNQTEYFRDAIGDACDFEEGDQDGWVALMTPTITVSDGIMKIIIDEAYEGARFVLPKSRSIEIFEKVRIRIKCSEEGRTLLFGLRKDDQITYLNEYFTLTKNWKTHEAIKAAFDGTPDEDYTDIRFQITSGSFPLTLYVDFVEIIEDLDYATHIESEVEDTWDWEDSDEYWYTEEENVSDFNDGSTEGWDNWGVDTDVSNDDGWLEIRANMVADRLEVNVSSLSIDASVYRYLTMEAHCINGMVDTINVFDSDLNPVGVDTTNIADGEYYLYNLDLGADADWTGTETGLGLYFYFTSSSADNELELNMTYLYDMALGDVEGFSGSEREYVNPEGYYQGTCAAGDYEGIYTPSSLVIDTDLFTILKIRTRTDDPNLTMKVRRADDWTFVGDLKSYSGTSWVEFEWVLSDDSDWIGTCTKLELHVDEDDGTLDGNELVIIDYVLLTGHWSESDGFKYSLLNADDEEGMSFQFTGNSDNSYNLTIDMYDSVGVALDYTYNFDYAFDVDGWLRLRVDWHLDKRNVKILLIFDNGTIILRVRRITDLYGGYLGFSNLLLLKGGFPSLCMNNSVYALARSYVIINYIDADWETIDWRDPGSPVWTYNWGSKSNYADSYFTAISPYGLTAYHKDRGDTYKFYRLTADRFDGLSFDVSTEVANLDTGTYNDWASFGLCIYNVQPNGTAMFIGEIFTETMGGSIGTSCGVYNATGDIIHEIKLASGYEDQQLDFSFGHKSAQKAIMHFHYKTETFDEGRQLTFGQEFAEDFTQEYTFILYYGYRTSWAGAADDEIDILMGNFELVRKDIWDILLGTLLGPLYWGSTVAGNIINFVLSVPLAPFILLFQALGTLLVKAFKDLATALEPFFGALADTLGGIFGTIIGGLEEALIFAFEGLWGLLWLLVAQFGQFVYDVLEWLIPILVGLIEIGWGLIMSILIWLWDDFIAGSPVGFIIVLIAEAVDRIPYVLMRVINLFLFWQFWILIGIWIIVLPMQAAQSDSISNFFERVIGVLCIDCFPFEFFLSFWFPLAIPLFLWTMSNILVIAW